jgi:hypothetical protein
MKNDTSTSRAGRAGPRIARAAGLLLAFLLAACATQPTREPGTERGFAPISLREKERPGIATRWGELRESWVEPAYFARAWGDRPGAVERILYNDRDGIAAMLEYIGGEPRPIRGLQPAAGGLVRLGLRDGAGQWLSGWRLGKQRFAVGTAGSRYEIVLKNETRRRIEVVVSVDGRDTLDGAPASVRKRGYVLAPRETAVVDGLRTSDGTVAAFRFAGVGESYVARVGGDTGNVGAIGVAVFTERLLGSPLTRPENRAWRRSEARDYPGSRLYAQPPDA